jgi:hypothetical protein
MTDAPTIPNETETRAKWGGFSYGMLAGEMS